MRFTISKEVSQEGIPYTELIWDLFLGHNISVSLRRYPAHAFVAYEDDPENRPGGELLADWSPKANYIVAKIPNGEFDPLLELYKLSIELGIHYNWGKYLPEFRDNLIAADVWPLETAEL